MEAPLAPVRAEYGRASDKLICLLSLLNEVQTEETKEQIRTFFQAIEVVDRHHDALTTSEERLDFKNNLYAFFRGETVQMPQELLVPLGELSKQIRDQGKIEGFLRCSEEIFTKGELLRVQQNIEIAIGLILEEGAATSDMMMLALDKEGTCLAEFIREVGALGKLCDDIIDLEEDLKNGERSYESTGAFYQAAIPKAISNGLKIILRYPHFTKPLFLLRLFPSFLRLMKRKLFKSS